MYISFPLNILVYQRLFHLHIIIGPGNGACCACVCKHSICRPAVVYMDI